MATMAHRSEVSTITLSDGRILGYEISAAPNLPTTAPIVLYFHGYPSSHSEGGMVKPLAAKSRVRFIALDRPGCGLSTFQEDRTYLDWPNDVLEFVDHIGANKFYIMACSGGSPYALACLKLIPREKLLGVAIAAGAFPNCFATKETPFATWLMGRAISSPWIYRWLPAILEWYVGRSARDPEYAAKFEKWFDSSLEKRPAKEVQCLQDPDVRRAALAACKEAFTQGSDGVAWEARLLTTDWKMPLEDLDGSRLDWWHGGQDKNCAVSRAVELTNSIEGCRLHILENEAHVSLLVDHSDEILSCLLEQT